MKKILSFSIFLGLIIFNFAYAADATPPVIVQDLAGNPETEVATTATVNAPAPTENFIIRDGDTILFSGTVPLPAPGTIDLNDNTGASHSINAQSVLSVLNSADTLSADLSISNLEYYTSFSSLYLKCITGTATGQRCDNWQYTVNDSYPSIGMDQNILSGGENVYVYFGPQYRVLPNPNEITTASTLTVTAEKYNYQDNTWITRTWVTVGLTQPDPNNPWTPTEVKTGAVNANGQAIFSSIPAGSYNVGIKEDFYFPTESIVVTVPPPPSSLSGGAVSIFTPVPKPEFNLKKAFDFLTSQQKENGSFGEDIYTDWAAIALASSPDYSDQKEKLKKYISESKPAGTLFTDYERRAMALLALGLNPYDMQGENYIGRIVAGFDGTQFGDPSLTNDDIFALIPLASAGYTVNDNTIAKDVQFILSKEQYDGSWEESIDLTAAVIQALKPFDSFSGVSDALAKASSYLANKQESDGGWGNIFSTSWTIQSAGALGKYWVQNGKNGNDYLAISQMTDGGALAASEISQNRIWATSYAIPAALGKSWSAILHPVSKPALPPMPASPEVLPQANNTVAVAPVEKKVTPSPSHISSPAGEREVSTPISQTQEMPTVLVATAEKSEAQIPIITAIVAVALAGGIILLRFVGYPR